MSNKENPCPDGVKKQVPCIKPLLNMIIELYKLDKINKVIVGKNRIKIKIDKLPTPKGLVYAINRLKVKNNEPKRL